MNGKHFWKQLIVWACFLPAWAWAGNAPAVGQRLVPIQLPTPASQELRSYLGLPDADHFDPTQISGRLLIIQIFSMYCPHCQREAPAVNRLFEAVQQSASFNNQVKMIGIGVGNSDFEVNHFKNHYRIQFPLFPDGDFVIHKNLGEVRTPFFIIATIGNNDNGKVLWTGSGNLGPIQTFMDRLNGFLATENR